MATTFNGLARGAVTVGAAEMINGAAAMDVVPARCLCRILKRFYRKGRVATAVMVLAVADESQVTQMPTRPHRVNAAGVIASLPRQVLRGRKARQLPAPCPRLRPNARARSQCASV
jgi:hypothetical protein